MNSFSETNLQNIKNIFEERTGVNLNSGKRRRFPVKAAIVIAAVLICCLTATAFASNLFSPLSGDDFSLSAVYEGNGVVSVAVENKSDKELIFQEQLKLKRWSTGEEIPPLSGDIIFTGTEIAAHSGGIMTVDISDAYDVGALEQPLTDDSYYFVLTNNDFIFGQDWMCFISFSEPVKTSVQDSSPLAPPDLDEEFAAGIVKELRPYFDNYFTGVSARRAAAESYLEKCRELLSDLDRNIVSPAESPLVIDGLNPGVVFDDTVPAEEQHLLSGLHRYTLDAYGIPVGSSTDESAIVLGAYVPQHKGDTDGGIEIPLLYFFTYSALDVQNPDDCVFIHGQILTLGQMERYKVYEDERYVCYDATDLFYTDLRQYAESIAGLSGDVYWGDSTFARVENIYNYFRNRNTLESRFYYLDSPSAENAAP